MTLLRAGAAALLLAALGCATEGSSPYRPRDAGKDLGYAELRVNERTYEVSFVAKSVNEAREGTLRRAAELSLHAGFTAFVLLSFTEGREELIRRRMIVGRARRYRPISVATIWMLRPGEVDPSGRTLYQAQLLAPPPPAPEPQ